MIDLVSPHDAPEPDTTFARIYWVPKGDAASAADGTVLVTLWESDEGSYVCEVKAECGEAGSAYETVRAGILAREWEIELLGQ